MKKEICIEAQSLFGVYKKREELPEDISGHLESCPACLLVFNRDLHFRKRLKEIVRKPLVPSSLEVSIREFFKKDKSLAQFAGRIN